MDVSPGQRLELLLKGRNLSQREAATLLSVSRGYIGDIVSGRSAPSRAFLQTLAERFQVSADWLLHGRGDMLLPAEPGFATGYGTRISPPRYDGVMHGDFTWKDREFSMIRRVDLSASAGNGLLPVDDGDADAIAFSTRRLQELRVAADLSVLVSVRGDSMVPTIPEGALVLIHAAEMLVKAEGIFAFLRDGAAFIKRLLPVGIGPDGRPASIVILSDNPSYAPVSVVGEAMNDLRIIGRVRAVLWTI